MRDYTTVTTFNSGEKLRESITETSPVVALRTVLAGLTGEDAGHINGNPCLRKVPGAAVTEELGRTCDSVAFHVFTEKPANCAGQRFWEALLEKNVKSVEVIGAADAAHLLSEEDFKILVPFVARNASWNA